jgi:transposase
MEKFIRIGVDLAKNYFQVHALTGEGGPAMTRKLARLKMRQFFSGIDPCLVGMEAWLGTEAIDDFHEISHLCRKHRSRCHVDSK